MMNQIEESENTINFEEQVIGFDVRIAPSSIPPWDIERRRSFLFRTDIDVPLSLDQDVWESLELDLGENGLRPYLPLWEDLAFLGTTIQSHLAEIKYPYWIICVTGIIVDGNEKGMWGLKKTTDFPQFQRCEKLGYDINDSNYWTYSALSNCGHAPKDEIDPAANMFSPHLNQYHLFYDVSNAWRFKQWADKIIPSHSPFNVFGIYRVME